jgi:hypothetical protein
MSSSDFLDGREKLAFLFIPCTQQVTFFEGRKEGA